MPAPVASGWTRPRIRTAPDRADQHSPTSAAAGGRDGHDWRMATRYEYKVVELREKMIGGKMSGSKLERLLNEQAADGWQLKAITTAEIKGRIGPGGVEGVLVTFERPAG